GPDGPPAVSLPAHLLSAEGPLRAVANARQRPGRALLHRGRDPDEPHGVRGRRHVPSRRLSVLLLLRGGSRGGRPGGLRAGRGGPDWHGFGSFSSSLTSVRAAPSATSRISWPGSPLRSSRCTWR